MKISYACKTTAALAAALAIGALAWGQPPKIRARSEPAPRDPAPPKESIVGAEVVAPSSNAFGEVVDVVRDLRTGEIAMYVVDDYGWFSGVSVVPVSNVTHVASVVDPRTGESNYRIEVKINQATFKNIADWDRKSALSTYLRENKSILALVYQIDAAALDANADNYALDSAVANDATRVADAAP